MIISDKERGQGGEGREDEVGERGRAVIFSRANCCGQDLELESEPPAFPVGIMCNFISLKDILQEGSRSPLGAGHLLRLLLPGLAHLAVPFARVLPSPGALLFPLGREAA